MRDKLVFQAGVQHSRRRFLRSATGLLLTAGTLPTLARARTSIGAEKDRILQFHNLHTGEKIRATIWAEGEYQMDELQQINTVLRDFRTGDVHPIDRELLEMLCSLQEKVQIAGPFNVISGYRSPATNEKLRTKSSGVAKKSFHMQGRAIDINLPGCDLSSLCDAAVSLQKGGVGYYPKSNFIHVDTGRVRRWG
ncbi:MAG: DUF882 domain-containing protein [Gammaproteobacteria bacterium]